MALSDPFFVRNLVYGIEDSLLSTTGVVAGVSLAGQSRQTVLVTGIILVFVEAVSMAFGSFISEDSFMKTASMKHTPSDIIKYATVMFVSYVVAGLIPLLPFILDASNPWRYSVTLALLTLFGLLQSFHEKSTTALALTGIGGVILGLSVMAGKALKH